MLEISATDREKILMTITRLINDKEVAEDIFQDTIVHIIDSMNKGKYNEEGKFLPWARRIAHNLCIDHFRRCKKNPIIRSDDDRDIFASLDISEAGVDEKIIKMQRHVKVTELLDMIPYNQKEVIIMRHYAELSFKEIAKLTDCSINTCLGRMRYGLANLRKLITENKIAL